VARSVGRADGRGRRTQGNLKFEEGMLRGAKNYDEVLMTLAGRNE
jgi:hypothetical protein